MYLGPKDLKAKRCDSTFPRPTPDRETRMLVGHYCRMCSDRHTIKSLRERGEASGSHWGVRLDVQ